MNSISGMTDFFLETTPILPWALLTFGFWLIETGVTGGRFQRLPNIFCGLVVCLASFTAAPFLIKTTRLIIGYTGNGLIDIEPLPDYPVLSLILSVFLFIFILDFFFYWWHRLEHKIPVLWDIHAIHHSEENLNGTTYMRQNWMDGLLQSFFVQIPIVVLFHFPAGVPHIAFLGAAAWDFLGHADLKWEMGRWSFLATSPQLHRLHHSVLKQHHDRNFTQFFPLWDILFGTYVPPLPGEFPATGLGTGRRIENNLPNLVIYPMRSWAQRGRALMNKSRSQKASNIY